jgi:raffinose/stachyose/melibiose transport system permease protein
VFLYAAFIRALPREYEEAAAIDGAGPIRTFWLVLFPLLSPVTASVAIINVIVIWNDFMTPLLYLSGGNNQTIPVAVFGFVGQYTSQWPVVFAGLVVGILPILALFFALQGRVMRGFSTGLKG